MPSIRLSSIPSSWFPGAGLNPRAIHGGRQDAMTQVHKWFRQRADSATRADWESFAPAEAHWLEDYALYQVLRAEHRGQPWWRWPAPLRDRERGAEGRASASGRKHHAAALRAVCREPPVAGASDLRAGARGCCFSATCRSSSRTTAPRSGRTVNASSWMRPGSRWSSPACHRIISPCAASAGAIRCTTGTARRPTAFSGGSRG